VRRHHFTFACRLSLLICMATAGCDYHPFHYDAAGRLLRKDGSPAAGMRVVMDGPTWWPSGTRTPRPTGPKDFRDYMEKQAVVTDSSGYFFSTDFLAGGLYSATFSTPMAPLLPEVYVWTYQGNEWELVIVPLDARAQRETYTAGRHIDLPAVVVSPTPMSP
jgi:hypothetical protein